MFKSKLIIILLCLCVVAGIANAQEKKPQVIQSEPQLEDIYSGKIKVTNDHAKL